MHSQQVVLVLPVGLAITAILMVSCANSVPSTTPTATVVASPRSSLADRPPVITARYAGQQQRGVLGTYCWNEVCGDTYLLIPTQPITVPPAAKIEFEMMEPILPSQWLVRFFAADASELVTWSDPNTLALGGKSELARAFPPATTRSAFQMPERAGDYAVSLSGEWRDGPYSGYDAFYGFHIVVSDSRVDMR